MTVCIYTTIFLIERTLCIYAMNLFMECCVKTAVYNFLPPSHENKGNVTPGSSKNVAPVGVDPPFPHCSQACYPLDHGSYDMEENAACCIRTPLISTSGCRLSSHSIPIHDVYTRPCYTLGESATPQPKHATGSRSRNSLNHYSHVSFVRPRHCETDDVIKPVDSVTMNSTHVQTAHNVQTAIKTNITAAYSDSQSVWLLLDSNPDNSDYSLHAITLSFRLGSTYLALFNFQSQLNDTRNNTVPNRCPTRCPTRSAANGKTTTDEKAKSSSTANSTRNSSISGRRPLRLTTGGQINSSSDGDDDNDENKKRLSGKLSSQCENSEPADNNLDDVASSTRIEQSHLGTSLFEMSILNSALSRVWNATRNATLFGTRGGLLSTTINMNVTLNNADERPETTDISFSLNTSRVELGGAEHVLGQSTSELEYLTVSPIALNSTQELYKNGAKELCYTGTAQPEITPVLKQKSITPIRKSCGRSLSNYLSKTGPYDIPPASLIKRRIKSKINRHHPSSVKGASPGRKRWSSESDTSEFKSSPLSIGCNRIREPGRYDCSIGLKNYIFFEHDFLDKSDTKFINKEILYESVRKSLEITMNEPSHDDQLDAHMINLAWDPAEVNKLSMEDHPNFPTNLVSTRNSLLYLLGRMNNHTARVIHDFKCFNGLKIWLLSDNNSKFCFEHDEQAKKSELPLVLLHIGASGGLNLIPRKHDRRIIDVFDVQLEDLSFLIESPRAYSTMETSLGRETNPRGSPENIRIIIIPCMTEYFSNNSESCPKEPKAVSQDTTCTGEEPPACQLAIHSHPSPAAPSIILQPPDENVNDFFTPMNQPVQTEERTQIQGEPTVPETTPVSTKEPRVGAKNLRELICSPLVTPTKSAIPNTPGIPSPTLGETTSKVHPHSKLRIPTPRVRQTSEGDISKRPEIEDMSGLPPIRRRHTSEGEVKHERSQTGPLNYKRFPIQEGGLHTCDGQEFHVSTLKSDPDITAMKPKILQEIKAALLDVSPQITPGQSTLSYADIVWDMSSSQDLNSDNNLRSMLCKINQQVHELAGTTTGFNGVRLIYAYNRTTKINLKPVNQAALPLVIVHVGKKRDLSITPTRFNPAIQNTEICDVVMGNFSMVILPHKSVGNAHTYFASEQPTSHSGDEQILLIPFSEKTFPPKCASITTTTLASAPAATTDTLAELIAEVKFSKSEDSLLENVEESDKSVSSDRTNLTAGASQSTLASATAATTDTLAEPNTETKFAKSEDSLLDNADESVKSVSSDRTNLTAGANQSISSSTEESNCEESSSGKPTSIHLKYITLDLLKRAASSYKKSTLNTLMPSLGLKGSKNVSMNKKKLCDLLDKCVSKGSKHTVHLVTHLVNKLEDSIIRMELLANYLPLNVTAQERKKALVAYYKDQCHGLGKKIKLTFDSPIERVPEKVEHLNASHFLNATTSNQNDSTSPPDQDDYVTPDAITSGMNSTRFQFITPEAQPNTNTTERRTTGKKKKTKKKKNRRKDEHTPDSSADSQQTSDTPETNFPGTTSESSVPSNNTGNNCHITADEVDTREAVLGSSERECSNCSELKTAITVLQESIATLREEMLQQKAISDLIVSTPSASNKKLEQMVKNRLNPILENQNRLRTDLNLLRETVDAQNRTLGLIADGKDQPHQAQRSELSLRIGKLEATRIADKSQIETLEIDQENLKKAIKSVAINAENNLATTARELDGELNDALQSIETVSSSNRTRIETLEINYENLVQISQNKQKRAQHSFPVQSRPKNDGVQSTKSSAAQQGSELGGKSHPDPNNLTWAAHVTQNKETKFTQADKRNNRNHNEVNRDTLIDNTENLTQQNQSRVNNLSSRSRRQSIAQNEESVSTPDINGSINHRDGKEYRRHTALLIHDELFDDFNPRLFNNQFNVHRLRTKSFEDLSNKTRQLNNTLKRLRPDCIYIHTGINDVLKRKAGVTSHVEELSDHLLKSTKAQICFSLMIPSTNDSTLNSKINKVNSEIVDYISWLHRNKPSTKNRIFSFTNDSLESYNMFSKNDGFNLRERGQKLLWLRLREGLRKTMRIARTNHPSESRSRRKTNRFSHQ